MPYITVGGERLFYAPVEGDLTGRRNLILVHGAGGDHTHWPAELRRLPGVNVYPLDLPGHGRSAGRGRTKVDEYADTVDLFVRAVGLERAAVAGHSMGGAIAQTLALRRPDWLVGVALIGSGARLRVHPLILDGLSGGVASRRSFEAAIETICQRQYGPAASPQLARKGRQQLLSVDPAVIHGDYLACNQFDAMDRVGDVQLPVLIITGSADQMTPPKYGQYLHERIAGSQLVEIVDGGHMMALEKPLEVSRAVARFLEAL
jgi:pimeloyl-ACP methyl ester carboxylesterase